MSHVLDADEVKRLTGAKQRAKVIKVLLDNGIRPIIGADGWPRVYASDVEALPSKRREREPNIDGLKKKLLARQVG